MCSRLGCRTWLELFLMKACYVGGFHKELTLWDLAQFNVLLRGIEYFYLNVSICFPLQELLS